MLLHQSYHKEKLRETKLRVAFFQNLVGDFYKVIIKTMILEMRMIENDGESLGGSDVNIIFNGFTARDGKGVSPPPPLGRKLAFFQTEHCYALDTILIEYK